METPHLLNIETHSPHKTHRPTCITLFTTIIQIQTQHKKLCSLWVLQLSASHELRREGDRERELEGGIPSFCMYAFSYPDPPSTLKTHTKKKAKQEKAAHTYTRTIPALSAFKSSLPPILHSTSLSPITFGNELKIMTHGRINRRRKGQKDGNERKNRRGGGEKGTKAQN
ncbi:hypothetical protein K457DRAFT_729122 [Linnemannia elongata AG-77]|uniref:Uncharacterized protein n=1 Tax=Linnemannia elongata AG-77 TaxID=1314771 RepID=A0A197JLT3_9FUNG|nr:hypothetical protein K457DRAFT_729122 [Linnemannia elongata AG-77]